MIGRNDQASAALLAARLRVRGDVDRRGQIQPVVDEVAGCWQRLLTMPAHHRRLIVVMLTATLAR